MTLRVWWATELYPDNADESIGIAGEFPVIRLDELRAVVEGMIAHEYETEVGSGYSGSGVYVLNQLLAQLKEVEE